MPNTGISFVGPLPVALTLTLTQGCRSVYAACTNAPQGDTVIGVRRYKAKMRCATIQTDDCCIMRHLYTGVMLLPPRLTLCFYRPVSFVLLPPHLTPCFLCPPRFGFDNSRPHLLPPAS
eukprot:359971-Chlamydomonas_euryale.AAC.3